MALKTLRSVILFLSLGSGLFACKDKEKVEPAPAKLFPVAVTRTASYTSDTVRSVYFYNPEDQITREEVFKNRVPQGFNLFVYNAAGKLQQKIYHDAAGQVKEKDEITYNAASQPERLSHAYLDAAGQPTPHHYRIHEFDSEGKITKWTDHMPSGMPMGSRTYAYPAAGQVTSPAYDQNGQLTSTSFISFDSHPHPFVNTAINLVTFTGNERQHNVKNAAGNVMSAYTVTLVHNAAGYPIKLTQVHADGVIKTETYEYRQ